MVAACAGRGGPRLLGALLCILLGTASWLLMGDGLQRLQADSGMGFRGTFFLCWSSTVAWTLFAAPWSLWRFVLWSRRHDAEQVAQLAQRQRQLARYALLMLPTWTLNEYFWYLSLRHTSLSANTVIYNSDCIGVFFLSVLLLREPFSWAKLGSVSLTVAGVTLVTLFSVSGAGEDEAEVRVRQTYWGYGATILSAMAFAMHQVLYQRLALADVEKMERVVLHEEPLAAALDLPQMESRARGGGGGGAEETARHLLAPSPSPAASPAASPRPLPADHSPPMPASPPRLISPRPRETAGGGDDNDHVRPSPSSPPRALHHPHATPRSPENASRPAARDDTAGLGSVHSRRMPWFPQRVADDSGAGSVSSPRTPRVPALALALAKASAQPSVPEIGSARSPRRHWESRRRLSVDLEAKGPARRTSVSAAPTRLPGLTDSRHTPPGNGRSSRGAAFLPPRFSAVKRATLKRVSMRASLGGGATAQPLFAVQRESSSAQAQRYSFGVPALQLPRSASGSGAGTSGSEGSGGGGAGGESTLQLTRAMSTIEEMTASMENRIVRESSGAMIASGGGEESDIVMDVMDAFYFMAAIGVLMLVLLWPIFVVLHVTGVEPLNLRAEMAGVFAYNFFFDALFNLSTNVAIALSSALLTSVLSIVAAPISMLFDLVLNSYSMPPLALLGSALIVVGFLGYSLAEFRSQRADDADAVQALALDATRPSDGKGDPTAA